MDDGLIQKIVAEVIRRLKALEGSAPPVDPPVKLVTEALILQVLKHGGDTVYIVPNAIVTPLARDLVRQHKVRIIALADGAVVSDVSVPKSQAIAIGADHRGYGLKEKLKVWLQDMGRQVIDLGCHTSREISYVEVSKAVSHAVVEKHLFSGIVIDGGGIPSAMVANKVKGIRAAACHDVTAAKFARAHVDANVLCLGVGVVGDMMAQEIVATWVSTPFEDGGFAKRVREIHATENEQ